MQAWDREFDLVVCGSGAAGLAAALVGAQEGLRVIVCEKTEYVGGSTAMSGGEMWIPGNEHPGGSTRGDLEGAAEYLEQEAGMPQGRAIRQAYLETAGQAIRYIEQHSELKYWAIAPHPDYHQDRAGASQGGRPLAPYEFDGRRLKKDFAILRPPRREFTVLKGMMVSRDDIPSLLQPFSSFARFRHATRLVLRHMLDLLTHGRGTRLVMGNAKIGALLYSLRRKGVEFALNTPLKDIVIENGAAAGVAVLSGGKTVFIRARAGVILATGGFPSSPELRDKYFGEKKAFLSLALSENVGDGLKAALGAGATVDTAYAAPAAFMPASVMNWKDGRVSVFPHIRDRAKPGLIAVNRQGKRFANESDSYQDLCLLMFKEQNGDPRTPFYFICDHTFVKKYGIGIVKPLFENLKIYEDAQYFQKADTIAGLAQKIGVNADNLAAAVAQNNRDAPGGVDTAFGRGSSFYNRHYGDPSHKPNPCLGPIETAPFYALAVYPTPINTYVGLKTDPNANVLDANDRPIPGLYACGNDMAAMARGSYPGPGSTIGPAVVFGYRAARHAAARPRA